MSQPMHPLPNKPFEIVRDDYREAAEFVSVYQEPVRVLLRGELFYVAETDLSDLKLMLSADTTAQMAILNDLRTLSGIKGEQDRSSFYFNAEPWLAFSLAVNQSVVGTPAP